MLVLHLLESPLLKKEEMLHFTNDFTTPFGKLLHRPQILLQHRCIFPNRIPCLSTAQVLQTSALHFSGTQAPVGARELKIKTLKEVPMGLAFSITNTHTLTRYSTQGKSPLARIKKKKQNAATYQP